MTFELGAGSKSAARAFLLFSNIENRGIHNALPEPDKSPVRAEYAVFKKNQRKRGNLQSGGWYHHSSEVREMRSKEALQIRILNLCDENDLSLNALSARCGITQSTLNNIVNGRNNSITIQTVLRICRGLGMELPEFFNDDLFRDIEQEIY